MYISADPIGLLGLLLLLSKNWGKGSSSSSTSAPAAGPALPGNTASTEAPWPQVLPAGLPVFPGSGWEYDEPPPAAVVKRAGQLVSTLWQRGSGTFKTELIGGRWITFRAEKVRSGKQGVVAYRQRIAKKPKPAETAAAPQAPAAQQPAAIPVSTSARQSVLVKNGHTYRWRMRIEGFDHVESIAAGLSALGATKISLQQGPPIVAQFELKALASKEIYLNEPTGMPFDGKLRTVTFLEIVEVLPEGVLTSAPAAATPVPAAGVLTKLPELKMGDGLRPAAPVEDVKVVQRRLGVSPDGRFGSGTRDAVIKFQVEKGLAPKGVSMDELRKRGFGAVKAATWKALFPAPPGAVA